MLSLVETMRPRWGGPADAVNRAGARRLLVLLTLFAGQAGAQSDSVTALHGVVRSDDGARVDAANVFILETLEGSLSGADGRFALRSARRGPATLVIRRIGFRSVQTRVTLPATAPVEIILVPEATRLAAVTVQAGRYTAGDERGATLTSLEVVTTPGAAVFLDAEGFERWEDVDGAPRAVRRWRGLGSVHGRDAQ